MKGIVRVDGKPMAGIDVFFNPIAQNGNPAYGSTDAQGNFSLSTPGAPFGSGAIPGDFIPTFRKTEVEVRPPVSSPEEYAQKYGESPPKTIYLIPEKYSNTVTCNFDIVTIEKGKSNIFEFDLSSK